MKKEEFLKLLRSKLDVLEEQEIEDIMEEYRMHIEEKMKDGTKEETVIHSFGNVDDLAKEILSAYKISDKYVKKEDRLENSINGFVDKMVSFFQDIAKSLTNQRGEEVLRTVVKFILIFILLLLLRIPFHLFEYLGSSVFSVLPHYLETVVVAIWKVLMGFTYFGLSVFLLYYAIKRFIIDIRVENVEPVKKETTTEKTTKKTTTKKSAEEEKVVRVEESSAVKTAGNALFLVIRILLTLFTFPFLFGAIGLVVAFGVLLSFAFQGIYLVSLLVLMFGLVLVAISVLSLFYHLIWKGGTQR